MLRCFSVDCNFDIDFGCDIIQIYFYDNSSQILTSRDLTLISDIRAKVDISSLRYILSEREFSTLFSVGIIFEIRLILTEILQIFCPGVTVCFKFHENYKLLQLFLKCWQEAKILPVVFFPGRTANRQNIRKIEAMLAKKCVGFVWNTPDVNNAPFGSISSSLLSSVSQSLAHIDTVGIRILCGLDGPLTAIHFSIQFGHPVAPPYAWRTLTFLGIVRWLHFI